MVIREKDYMELTYRFRIETMKGLIENSNSEEIHIFGYSMDDFEILRLIVGSDIDKICIYLVHESLEMKEIQESHFEDI